MKQFYVRTYYASSTWSSIYCVLGLDLDLLNAPVCLLRETPCYILRLNAEALLLVRRHPTVANVMINVAALYGHMFPLSMCVTTHIDD